MTGQNFLRSPFGASSLLAVEIAWGADLTADPDTWVWSDITSDVRQSPGLAWTFGKGDEASVAQPARCSFLVGNRSGAYSLGGESSNWPNVRKGTPVRVRIDPDGAGFVDPPAFQGEATGFTPQWNLKGNDAVVKVEAAGTLRRLSQGQSPVQSALRRGIPNGAGLLAYWPCEDGPESHGIVPATGSFFMSFQGTPNFAASSTLLSSAPLPVLNGSVWVGAIAPAATASATINVRFIAEFPGESAPDEGVLMSIRTSGTAARFDLVYLPTGGGILTFVVYDQFDSIITFDPTGTDFGINTDPLVRRYDVSLFQNGADVVCIWGTVDAVTADDSGYGVLGVTSRTMGQPLIVIVNGAGNANAAGALSQVAVGHIAVYDRYPGYLANLQELLAYRGERADDRLMRLCDENSETIEITGSAPMPMGAQTIATLLELLRECEAADDGVLHDGRGPGLVYVARSERENQTADMAIDAAAGELAEPFGPVDDDQRTRNKVTVTRTNASELTFEDTDGPMGTDMIGVYDTSISVNLATDGDAYRYAQWGVHLGTQEGYRYPQATIDVRETPALARDVLAVSPTNRVDITGIGSVLRSYPSTADLSLIVEGAAMSLTADEFKATLASSSYEPWRIATVNPAADGTAITYIGASVVQSSANTAGDAATMTIQYPTNARTGDLAVVFATIRNSGAGTCPAPDGFTMLLQSGNCSIYGRFVEPADVYPNPDGLKLLASEIDIAGGVANATVVAQGFVVRGVHPDITQVVHASAAQLNASAQNIAYPALTVSQADCFVAAFGWKQDDFTSVAAVAGMTEFMDGSTTSGDDSGIVADYVIQPTASNLASGSFVVTGGASAISRGLALALAPAPVPDEPFRPDTSGSTLAASISAGATSMSVDTASAGPISYVGIGAVAVGNNASVAPALPAGLSAGDPDVGEGRDLLIAVAAIRNSGTGTVVVPSGWFDIKTSGNVSVLGRWYQTDDAAPTITFSGGVANATTIAQCLALRGVSPNVATVLNTSAVQLNGSAANIALPAVAASHDDVTILAIGWKQDDWTSVATLSGFTEISDSPTLTGDDAGLEIQYRLGGSAGAGTFGATSFAVTGGASAISRGLVLAFQPSTVGIWTAVADDYPIDLDVGGIKITATACSDTTSPQTMTINAAPLARTSGTPVKLWLPPVLGR